MTANGPRYQNRFRVGWGDVDSNGHMANTAFLDRSADTRFLFFALHGFPAPRFLEERIGPVIVRDEVVYRKELRLLEEFKVDLELAGISPDGVRFQIRNGFESEMGDPVAVVASEGVWLDLDHRRPRTPPPELDAVMRKMPRSDPFREISPRPR